MKAAYIDSSGLSADQKKSAAQMLTDCIASNPDIPKDYDVDAKELAGIHICM